MTFFGSSSNTLSSLHWKLRAHRILFNIASLRFIKSEGIFYGRVDILFLVLCNTWRVCSTESLFWLFVFFIWAFLSSSSKLGNGGRLSAIGGGNGMPLSSFARVIALIFVTTFGFLHFGISGTLIKLGTSGATIDRSKGSIRSGNGGGWHLRDWWLLLDPPPEFADAESLLSDSDELSDSSHSSSSIYN